jgi:hypothetical protein
VSFKNIILSNTTNCNGAGLSIIDNGGNLQSSASCGSLPVGNANVNPSFVPQPGSPAIDAGVGAGCPSNDFYGTARPKDGNSDGSAICDIGAVEVKP